MKMFKFGNSTICDRQITWVVVNRAERELHITFIAPVAQSGTFLTPNPRVPGSTLVGIVGVQIWISEVVDDIGVTNELFYHYDIIHRYPRSVSQLISEML